MVVDGDILRHGQHECRLSHGGTRRDDDEVGLLPTRSNLVEGIETAGDTRDVALVLRSLAHALESLGDDGVNLRDVACLRALGYFKDARFGELHEVVHVLRLVVALLFYLARHGDEVACGGFLRHDLCVITQVRRRCHALCQFAEIDREFPCCAVAPPRRGRPPVPLWQRGCVSPRRCGGCGRNRTTRDEAGLPPCRKRLFLSSTRQGQTPRVREPVAAVCPVRWHRP